MLQDLPRKGPRCWLFWCTVTPRSGCLTCPRRSGRAGSVPKPLDSCGVGRYPPWSWKPSKDPLQQRNYFGLSNSLSSGLTFPLHRSCRTVGPPHHQPGWGLWDHCRGNFLNGGICRRLLCLCPAGGGPTPSKARYQPRRRHRGSWLPAGGGLGDRERHHLLQRERRGSRHHQGKSAHSGLGPGTCVRRSP